MRRGRVIVVGAGIGGLTAGLVAAAHDCDVTILEAAADVGGKMRQVRVGDGARAVAVDAGPTVFTMRWVFDELFENLGLDLDQHLRLTRAETLARHAWDDRGHLDLYADTQRSADAIAQFSGPAEGRRFTEFLAAARDLYARLETPFLRAPAPSAIGLTAACGASGLLRLARIGAFTTMWRALGGYFRDPRLHQLFGRYATYCGASPFEAPGTLMLVAHVEQSGVWLVEGGMHALPRLFADLAVERGARIRTGTRVAEILVERGRTWGVRLADGEVVEADAVISNADSGALAAGLFGAGVARASRAVPPAARSFSAITFNAHAVARGLPLSRHTVLFSSDTTREFRELRAEAKVPDEPTIYVCAQDRSDHGARAAGEPERLLLLVNAPPKGDTRSSESWEMDRCATRILDRLTHFGLELDPSPGGLVGTSPTDFHRLFPGTGGALYGRASHGWRASFQRASTRTRVAGLYLAGGSTHPGPGVPMATLSGRLAANALLADLRARRSIIPAAPISRSPSRPADMAGGTSTA